MVSPPPDLDLCTEPASYCLLTLLNFSYITFNNERKLQSGTISLPYYIAPCPILVALKTRLGSQPHGVQIPGYAI